MDRDPKIDPRFGDYVQVGEVGYTVVETLERFSVTFTASDTGLTTKLDIPSWRNLVKDAKLVHACAAS